MRENEPLMVTILCLVYNHESYIRQCLEGFVMQKTNFRFEAIVHDDASTDGTAAIIREYAEKYPDIIKPIFETENQYSKGDGSLGRIMTAHTHGKYVAICVEAICLIPLTYICILIFAFTYKPMHIVEKDGIKCVAYVRAFLRVYVDYYEYRNPLITGDEVLFTDYFGKGGFDPFVDGYEYDSMIEENAAMDDTTEITDDSEDERIDNENIFSQQKKEDDTAIDTDSDGYPMTEEFQSYKKELTAVATYIRNTESYQGVKAGDELSEFLAYNISAKGYPYVNIAEQVYEQDGISTIATHYIIINESYVENGSREYVYQIKFKDKSGNEVASTKVVDFYLIDTETLEITDEKTNDWH